MVACVNPAIAVRPRCIRGLFFLLAFSISSHAGEAIELVSDPDWMTGFRVIAPKPLGKKVFVGVLKGPLGEESPRWQLAQWSSHFSLAGATAEKEEGGVTYRDGSKRVRFGNHELLLAIDSIREWNGRSRKKGESWPHLLVSQEFRGRCPPLSRVAAIPFRIEVCIPFDEREEPPGYTPKLHAAQCLLYFIVKNFRPSSPGYGDFLWMGVPLYDDRGPVRGHVIRGDVAHDKVIFMPSRSVYTLSETRFGEWIPFEADLRSLAEEALAAAWDLGKLTGSKDLADYRIEGMNLGWEMPGNHRVESRFRHLSVKAIPEPRPANTPAQ